MTKPRLEDRAMKVGLAWVWSLVAFVLTCILAVATEQSIPAQVMAVILGVASLAFLALITAVTLEDMKR